MTHDQRRAADPGASVWVAASAGTGKTKVLTDRVLGLMLAGTLPSRILCLTFTKAAAAEMANRIAKRLGLWTGLDDAALDKELAQFADGEPDEKLRARARRLFTRVLDAPGGMKIQTIHAFCQSLLRRFPLEAGMVPHFEVMDDRTAAEMLRAAREEVLSRARAEELSGGGPLYSALVEVTSRGSEDDFAQLMAELSRERGRLRRLIDSLGLDGALARLRGLLGLAEGDSEGVLLAVACAEAAFAGSGLRAVAAAMLEGSKTDRERGAKLATWLAADLAGERAAGFERYCSVFFTDKGEIRKKLCTNETLKRHATAAEILAREAERLEQLRERLRAMRVATASAALLRLGQALLAAYKRHKALRALLDYDDLVLAAKDLLQRPGVAPWVLFKLDGGIDHILIDEAQDTNPDQWQVVEALAAEFFDGIGARDAVRTVFAVGDAKQSIFSFQRADPAGFERMRAHFAQRCHDAEMRWDDVALDVSFRSTEAVLKAVDLVFANAEARDGVAPPDRPIRHEAHRAGHGGMVEIWPLIEPRDEEDTERWEPPTTNRRGDSPPASLAKAIAARIGHWIDSGEMLESQGRPLRAGDCLVLVQRRTGFVDELVRALKERRIPVAGIDRMVLSDQIAVMDLIALGRFLLLPEDDLNLAALLKSPLIGLSEERLFDLCRSRSKTLWRELRIRAEDAANTPELAAELVPDVVEAHAILSGLLARVDFARPYELFAELLGAGGGRRKLLARLGPEAADPLDEFLSLALAFEKVNVPSLQGFLHWLEAGRSEIKRDLEQAGRDEVRIMTVHGAKGLQAPVVFLPDTTRVPTQAPRLLWPEGGDLPLWSPRQATDDPICAKARAAAALDRDREYRRLLYVALTRAEDRLYVCGWRTRRGVPSGCWHALSLAALGAEDSGAEDIDSAGWEGTGRRLLCVQTAAPEDKKLAPIVAREAALPPFATRLPEAEPVPPRPLVPSRPDEDPPVRSPLGGEDGQRFKRGRLIHRLLQSLPDLAPRLRDEAAARFLARHVHGLDAALQAEIKAETLAVLESYPALFGPNSRAEVPLVGLVGGQVMSGQVDRLLVEAGVITVVDYKTNRPPPERESEVADSYLRQMAAYRAALRQIYPGREVRCALLWSDGPNLMWLSDDVLYRHAP